MTEAVSLPPLTIFLAGPRGFCAGVERAVQMVERALAKYGRPVYVRHEIVHNRFVVEQLEAQGAVFIAELDEAPDGRPVVFSAHGVPKSVPAEARRRDLIALDATCPLVAKVHREAEAHHAAGRRIILVGHAGHPEVIGTIGQLPPGAVMLVETVAQAEAIAITDQPCAYLTQTTLSLDDAAAIVAALKQRLPAIAGPRTDDICYATTNRQSAVKQIARRCQLVFVIGAPNSSNAQRLVEVAHRAGCARTRLIQRAAEIDWRDLAGVTRLGLTAGASAPERLVREVIDAAARRFAVTIEEVCVAAETVIFKLPPALAG